MMKSWFSVPLLFLLASWMLPSTTAARRTPAFVSPIITPSSRTATGASPTQHFVGMREPLPMDPRFNFSSIVLPLPQPLGVDRQPFQRARTPVVVPVVPPVEQEELAAPAEQKARTTTDFTNGMGVASGLLLGVLLAASIFAPTPVVSPDASPRNQQQIEQTAAASTGYEEGMDDGLTWIIGGDLF